MATGKQTICLEVPSTWQEDAQVGVRFWHLEDAPQGSTKNIKAKSQEANIASQKKIFELWYEWYSEAKPKYLIMS